LFQINSMNFEIRSEIDLVAKMVYMGLIITWFARKKNKQTHIFHRCLAVYISLGLESSTGKNSKGLFQDISQLLVAYYST
ncbi:hypothetical protein ACJX0J_034228, partial [Zea mays]